jgi:glycosyltransferase involved in cell wall biosynthesis
MSKSVRVFNTYEPVISLVRDLAPFLRDAGLPMELIISRSEYRAGRTGLSECLSRVGGRVVYIPSGGVKAKGRFGKLLASVTYAVGASLYSLFSRGSAVNIFLTQPPLFFAWSTVLKLVRRQPYIVVLMDMYPEALILNGGIRKGGLLARVLGKVAKAGLVRADRVIVIGRCMRENVISLGADPMKLRYIPNWADEAKIFPVQDSANDLRRQLGLQHKFVVLYSGNMGIGHRFDDILEVARLFRNERDIRFVFIGGGARRVQIEDFIANHHLKNVLMHDFVPVKQMPEAQSLGDVHFVSLREEFDGTMVPSKVYGALAAGRAIIYQGGSRAEIARMISEEDIGAVVQEGDVARLYEVVLSYFRNQSEARRQGARALRLAHDKYCKQNALDAYLGEIMSVLGMSSRRNDEREAGV